MPTYKTETTKSWLKRGRGGQPDREKKVFYNLPTGSGDFVSNTTLQVPKCGSTTVGGVLKGLSRRNNFSIRFSTNYRGYFLPLSPWNPPDKSSKHATCNGKTSQVVSPNEQEWLVKKLTSLGKNRPVIYVRHFLTLVRDAYILPEKDPNMIIEQDIVWQREHNFEWINFVREPVSRLVS